VAGGHENRIQRNRVTGSERYGIAVFPTARRIVFDPSVERDPGPPWRPHGNRVSNNVVSGSGRADLALARGVGAGNCFVGNKAARALPRNLGVPRCSSTPPAGDARIAAELTAGVYKMFESTMRRRQPPPYTSMPAPPPQSSMPAGSR